jgi:hypothetical protein
MRSLFCTNAFWKLMQGIWEEAAELFAKMPAAFSELK